MNIKQKSDKFRSIVNEIANLYEQKNSNYEDSFGINNNKFAISNSLDNKKGDNNSGK